MKKTLFPVALIARKAAELRNSGYQYPHVLSLMLPWSYEDPYCQHPMDKFIDCINRGFFVEIAKTNIPLILKFGILARDVRQTVYMLVSHFKAKDEKLTLIKSQVKDVPIYGKGSLKYQDGKLINVLINEAYHRPVLMKAKSCQTEPDLTFDLESYDVSS